MDVEARIPAKHPLRAMRRLTDAALAELDLRFSAPYERIGRPSIPPERLLRATLLQLLYSLRSKSGQLAQNGWSSTCCFAGSSGCRSTKRGFDASTFCKNRDPHWSRPRSRKSFCLPFSACTEVKGLLSAEHFSVDGTLLKAWASMKSFHVEAILVDQKVRGPAQERITPQSGRNGRGSI